MQRDDASGVPAPIEAVVRDSGQGSYFVIDTADGRSRRLHLVVPGDRVRARLLTDDERWAEVIERVEGGPGYRTPPCSLATRCGGCHWQQLDEATQRDRRRARLLGGAARLGIDLRAIPLEELRSAPFGYRVRARLQIDGQVTPPRIGFHGTSDWSLVDAPHCPLFTAPLSAAYAVLRRAIGALPQELRHDITGAELTALDASSGALCYLNPRDRAPAAWPEVGERLLSSGGPPLVGVTVRLPANDPRPDVIGQPQIRGFAPAGLPVVSGARGFVQANLACAEQLAARLGEWIDAAAAPRLLELFGGNGWFGWALAAAGAQVESVERDPIAVQAAQQLPPPPRGSFRSVTGDARRRLATLSRDEVDLILTDPPRSGLGSLASALALHGPRRLLLVSCSTRSVLADIAALQRGGYRLVRGALAEFYPQSHHAETAFLLERG